MLESGERAQIVTAGSDSELYSNRMFEVSFRSVIVWYCFDTFSL